jgi:putative ABC transport system permease protein
MLTALVAVAIGGAIGATWVQQRTREIGLLKAIGWRGSRIVSAILYELLLVGFATGAVGVACGVLMSEVGTAVIAQRHWALLPVEAWTGPGVLVCVAAMLGVPTFVALGGLRGGLAAVRIDADDALRDL